MTETTGKDPNLIVLQALIGIHNETTTQTQLLSALLSQQQGTLRQAQIWKQENKELSRRYGAAAKLANEMMHELMREVVETLEQLDSGGLGYQHTECVNEYGSRVQQLGTILQMLSNLGT